jgi:hypothetical protein
LDCAQWAIDNKLANNCQTAVCDTTQSFCVVNDVPDITKCPQKCQQVCPPTKCQTFTCSYGANQQVICTPQDINCIDNNPCTTDTCDLNSGCVHTFVDSDSCHKCTLNADCSALVQKLGPCYSTTCDTTLGKCNTIYDNTNPSCQQPPPPPPCPAVCVPPSNKCQIATLVKTATTCTCEITTKNCDDKIDCTVDSCVASTGLCSNVFTPSFPKCTAPCNVDAQCAGYGISNKLSENCKIPFCDKTSGSCAAKDDTKTNCKKCQLDCKPNSNCDSAQCVWVGTSYQCQHTAKNCDDGKTCTTDSCDTATGQCVHTYVNCSTPQCNTDIDCAAWGKAKQLSAKCYKPVCDTPSGSCQSIPDLQCKHTCNYNSDCLPGQFGSFCDTTNTCVNNLCQFDADCTNTDANFWNYCSICNTNGQKCCQKKLKCHTYSDCDDSNPCTQDVCLPEYGFCRNLPLCDDNNACTKDIATPSSDGKSCTCSNPPIPCTQNSTLLTSDFVLLTNQQKVDWLGKCDKKTGCITCVVNAQCDDHNGCSYDSCDKQYCQSAPINNQWCDPVLASQPIYYQSIPGLRDQLILAGYDIEKLAT